jgi:hypothetical protein
LQTKSLGVYDAEHTSLHLPRGKKATDTNLRRTEQVRTFSGIINMVKVETTAPLVAVEYSLHILQNIRNIINLCGVRSNHANHICQMNFRIVELLTSSKVKHSKLFMFSLIFHVKCSV